MDNLLNKAEERNKKQKELEQRITELAKEHYRLQGKPYYEPAIPELEAMKKGEG